MVEVTVGKKDAREILETGARLQDLALCALAAVDQKSVLIVFDDLRGKAAFCGGRGGGSAKEEYFKQSGTLVKSLTQTTSLPQSHEGTEKNN